MLRRICRRHDALSAEGGAFGFANLKLAGCWIDTGFNTTCIEAAVMSGMQAARAICGEPVHVLGEDLLQAPATAWGGRRRRCSALEVISVIESGVERSRALGVRRRASRKRT